MICIGLCRDGNGRYRHRAVVHLTAGLHSNRRHGRDSNGYHRGRWLVIDRCFRSECSVYPLVARREFRISAQQRGGSVNCNRDDAGVAAIWYILLVRGVYELYRYLILSLQ